MESRSFDLFQAQSDSTMEKPIEKVVLQENEIRHFFNLFDGQQKVEVTGLFGSLAEVQLNLLLNYDLRKNRAIICLIFPEAFFSSKPLEEKSIKLTLFRIFTDFVDHIQICFRQQIYDDWYYGDKVPFSVSNSSTNYQFHQSSVKKGLDIDAEKCLIAGESFFKSNISQPIIANNFAYSIFVKEADKVQKDFSDACWQLAQKLHQKSQQKQFESQFLSNQLKSDKILKYYDQQILEENFQRMYANMFSANNFKTIFQEEMAILKRKLRFLPELYFCISRFTLKDFKSPDNMSEIHCQFQKEDKFNLGKRRNGQFYEFLDKKSFDPILHSVFKLQDNSELFIFYNEKYLEANCFILQLGQSQWVKIHDFKDLVLPIFAYLNQNNSLYVFNQNYNTYIISITQYSIQNNILIKQQESKIQQHFSYSFNFDKIIYLQVNDKFIVRAYNKQLYSTCKLFLNFHSITLVDYQNNLIPQYEYQQLCQCPSGSYFYLSNQQQCDMFNCNYSLLKRIVLDGRLRVTPCQNDVVLLGFKEKFQQIQGVIIRNLIETKNFKPTSNNYKDTTGNPGIDIIKGSLVKFGPFSKFFEQINFQQKYLYVNSNENLLKIMNYLKKTNLQQFCILKQFEIPQFSVENLKALQQYSMSRVPIQLCAVENESLIPLINGFRKEIQQKNNIKIQERAEHIILGHLEKLLKSLNEKIFVVSIMGKQSSGKSYLLNRIFETRYSVSASRCTNGVWASFATISNCHFLILDCEGLFNQARSQKEEQLMLAFSISISDITILNQDLNFSRHITDLLQNLTKASTQLKGNTLFQGALKVIVRDVNSQDNRYIDEELLDSLLNPKEGCQYEFIQTLFKNQISMKLLVNNESTHFDSQISALRDEFIAKAEQSERWENGRQLLQTIKITLCQLEMLDKTDTSILQQKTDIQQLINFHKIQWFIELLKCIAENDQFLQNTKNFYLLDENNTEENLQKLSQITIKKINEIYVKKLNNLNQEQKSKLHQPNLRKMNEELLQILETQQRYISKMLEEKLKLNQQSQDLAQFINEQRNSFYEFLGKQQVSLTFCMEKCQQCFLPCSFFNIHYQDTQQKILEISNEIEQLERQKKKDITFNQKILIEEFAKLDDSIQKLKFQQQTEGLQEKINQLGIQFQQVLNENQESTEFINKITNIIGNFENFNMLNLNSNQLKQLNNIKSNLDQRLNENTREQEKLYQLQKQLEIDSELNDIQTYSLSQYENLPQEILNFITNIESQDISQQKFIELLEQQVQKYTEDSNKIIIEIQNCSSKLTEINKLIFQESNEIIQQQICNQISELEDIEQQMDDLDAELKKQQKAYRVTKEEAVKSNIDAIKLQIKKLDDMLLEIDVAQQLRIKMTKISKDDMVQYFKDLQREEEVNCKNKLNKLQIAQQELDYLIFSGSQILDKKRSSYEQQLSQNQKLEEIQIHIQKLKKQIQGIHDMIGIAVQKEKYDEILSHLQESFEFSQQIYEGNCDFEFELQQLQIKQEQILESMKLIQEQQQIQVKLSDLNKLKEEITTHQIEHSCQRKQHGCEEFCSQCEGEKCKLQAGHQGSHFCEKLKHQCTEKCSSEDCSNFCFEQIGHKLKHQCKNLHQCEKSCFYCNKRCALNKLLDDHDHNCNDKQCFQKCFYCEEQCQLQHNHSREEKNTHLCSKLFHTCQHQCEEPGYCIILYDQINSIYQTSSFKQEYVTYFQKGCKQSCSKLIKTGEQSHADKHICSLENQIHTCESRCPECNALCIKKFGHEGQHSTQQHRNKDTQCFTQVKELNFNREVSRVSKYQPGDSAKLENCLQSCERRGRSHYHIVECKGDSECLEKKINLQGTARHSLKKYIGFDQLNFDEIQCADFWKLKNWEHPVTNESKKLEIGLCNYFCAICKSEKQNFCQSKAWHNYLTKSKMHIFSCSEEHKKNKFVGIKICFVIDSTGSMWSYLQKSIEVIKTIMTNAQKYQQQDKKFQIKFSVAAYKDHDKSSIIPYKLQNFIVNTIDFTDEKKCVNFLSKIKPDGGDDTPEAVLDGLYWGIRMDWSKNFYKVLYLIADAPPHGSQGQYTYHNLQDENFPTGCPCGLKQNTLLKEIQEKGIKLKVIKLNQSLEMMVSEFKKDYKDLEDFQVNDQNYVSTIVKDVSQVLDEEITYDEQLFKK